MKQILVLVVAIVAGAWVGSASAQCVGGCPVENYPAPCEAVQVCAPAETVEACAPVEAVEPCGRVEGFHRIRVSERGWIRRPISWRVVRVPGCASRIGIGTVRGVAQGCRSCRDGACSF